MGKRDKIIHQSSSVFGWIEEALAVALSLCFMCLWSPCCLSPVHAEEEPSVQPAEGEHCVVHGELQHIRQRQVSGCQGSAQGLGAGHLCSECCCGSWLSGTNYHYNDGCWRSLLIEIVVRPWWAHPCLRKYYVITERKYHTCCFGGCFYLQYLKGLQTVQGAYILISCISGCTS